MTLEFERLEVTPASVVMERYQKGYFQTIRSIIQQIEHRITPWIPKSGGELLTVEIGLGDTGKLPCVIYDTVLKTYRGAGYKATYRFVDNSHVFTLTLPPTEQEETDDTETE